MHQRQNAFTLLEIMVAMAILAVGLMATTAATFTSVNAKDYTNERDLALMAIESALEDVLTNPFIAAEDFEGTYPVTGLTVPDSSAQSDVLEVTIDEIDNDPDVLRVTMRCEWLHRGTPETMELVFIHTNRGG